MNNDRLAQLKSIKRKTMDHLDALKDEEFKLWSLAHNAGAVGVPEPDADVALAIHVLDEAIHDIRRELLLYINAQIDGEKRSEA